MSRRKRGVPMEDDEPELNMSSLIDVTFLLLIYFIVTSTIQPKEKDLPMTLPSSASTQAPVDVEPMLIAVKSVGSSFSIVVNQREQLDTAVEGKERKLPQLLDNLVSYSALVKSGGKEPVVNLFIDPELPQQVAMDVLNCLRGADINSVTFTDIDN